MSGKTISIQKQLLKLLEEKLIEQENYIDLLTQRINALEKTSGAHFIWKIGHYHVWKIVNCLFLLNDSFFYLLGKN